MDLSICCDNVGEAKESQETQQNLEVLRFRQKSKFFPYSNDLKINGTHSLLLF